ncbi:TIGR04255 family protein [Rhizobium leguminosarum]|uniref:TIGR04255 family protein n=1 Tax=Rhizobium TaxID=379 RepID=UPI0014787B61|nr:MULTISPECIES: TIGR04255 family protein [Rhizobium]MBY5354575.1 TIGR04255 family protein [Rhizobium leguminosarum]NNH44977.1 TIGR04255 family protein [Rhizobium laguerreae]
MSENTHFRPLNEDHAVAGVKFAVVLNQVLQPQAISAAENSHEIWRESLPAASISDVAIDAGGRQLKAPGVLFAFLRPDGTANWSMQLGGNKIEVECNLYSRWDRVWMSALGYLASALSVTSQAQNNLAVLSVELTVRDVFVALKRPYELSHLIKIGEYFPRSVLSAGPLWHCNTGWFDDAHSGGNGHLHNLNCDAAPANNDVIINITHFQQKRLPEPVLVQGLQSTLDITMKTLHEKNKTLLREILTQEMLTRIGL